MAKVIYSTAEVRAAEEQRKADRAARKRYEVHAYIDSHEYKKNPQWVNVGHYHTLWGAKRQAKFYAEWMGHDARIIDTRAKEA